jgi:hypothetical protein
MEPLVEGVWQVKGPSLDMIAGVMIPSRSTVLRLQSGALLVYSPIAEMPGVDAHARVAHVVAPSRWHRMFLGAAKARWPDAKVSEPDGERTVDDDAIAVELVGGVPKFDETVVFHRPSGTLVVADFVFNMTAENLRTRMAFALTGVGGNRVAQSKEWRWACKDRAAARASVERVLAWPIQRIAFCHGDSVEIDSAGLSALMRI